MRAIVAATAAAFVAATALGFGLVSPESASAAAWTIAPPPTSTSSMLSATMTAAPGATKGVLASEAAAMAGSGGTVAAGIVSKANVVTGGLSVGIVVGATVVGAVMRTTGQGTAGLCAAGSMLAGLYGQDCSAAEMSVPESYVPNGDAIGTVGHFCTKEGPCVDIDFDQRVKITDNQQGAVTYAWPVTLTGQA
jgi:hypothetical protein